MSEELKGKLNARKTKKGFHIEIRYVRKGKEKVIRFPAKEFPSVYQNLDVSFVFEGSRVVEIRNSEGKVIWTQAILGSRKEKVDRISSQSSSTPEFGDRKIPKDAISFLKKLLEQEYPNPSLEFNKFLRWNPSQRKFDYALTLGMENGVHKREIETPSDIKERINKLLGLNGVKFKNLVIEPWQAKTTWRMVIGLGSPHVHETAMTWHHTWSIPYISGSGLKGVTRSYFLAKVWEKFSEANPDYSWEETIPCLEAWLMDEPHPDKKVGHEEKDCPVIPWAEKNLRNEKTEFQLIFGTKDKKGLIIFMDAYPVGTYTLKLDVMNVHYLDYYGEKKNYAADWESPNPVFFLTVVDTNFKGLIGINSSYYANLKEHPHSEVEILSKAKGYLLEALKEAGIGAKTSVGYGVLK